MSENQTPGQNEVAYWVREVEAARKRLKTFISQADKATKLYSCDQEDDNHFNILFANTETLLPAMYNQTPKPVVKARFGNPNDPIPRAVAELIRHGLTYQIDEPDERYTSLDDLMEAVVLHALVPGRGILWSTYDAKFKVYAQKSPDPVTAFRKDPSNAADPNPEAVVPGEGQREAEEADAPIIEVPEYESVCGTIVPYDRYFQGYARSWKAVPWIAREHRMTKADWESNKFPRAEENCFNEPTTKQGEEGKSNDEENREGTAKVAVVYEIWHKARREVIFVCPEHKEGVLKKIEDPLGLPGFYPTYKPLQFIPRVDSLEPVVPYESYRPQARELNRISQRINKIIDAIKVRGFYDSRLKELANLMDLEDNKLLPASATATLQDGGGLDKHIWTMPIDKLIGVLQQLYVQRQQTKQVIYEITGISDIIRGSTVASETATAQELKSSYGTMRLKRSQRMVQVYVRGTLRIWTSIMAKHYDEETWQNITGLQFGRFQEKQAAMQQMQQLQAGMQSGEQIPPEQQQMLQQQMQQLQQAASQVTWEEVMNVLKSDITRGYAVDIETNSTIDPESAMEQKQAMELFGAIGQMTQSMGGMVAEGKLPLGAFKAMMLAVARRFSFGTEVEEHLLQMADQMPQQQDPQMQKMQEEMQKKEEELKKAEMELEMKRKEFEMEKGFALKEIELHKKAAIQEIKFAQKASAQQTKFDQMNAKMGIQEEVQNAEMGLAEREAGFEMQQREGQFQNQMQVQEGLQKVKQADQQAQMRQKAAQAKPKPKGGKK